MIFVVFSGLAFGLPVVGGFIAYRLLSIKKAMIAEALLLTFGFFA